MSKKFYLKKFKDDPNGFGLEIFIPESVGGYFPKGAIRITSLFSEEVTYGLLYCLLQGYFKEDSNELLSSSESVSNR